MYNTMKRLIERRFYKSAEQTQGKLDVFYAVNRISDHEYAELTALVAEVYSEQHDNTQEV